MNTTILQLVAMYKIELCVSALDVAIIMLSKEHIKWLYIVWGSFERGRVLVLHLKSRYFRNWFTFTENDLHQVWTSYNSNLQIRY